MTTIMAHIKTHAGKERQFEEISRSVYEGTHANEPGMNRYEYYRGTDPQQYYVLLSFADFDAFMTHQVADYHHSIGPGLAECVAELRLEYVDPVDHASPLARCETSGQKKSDAGEIWNQYVENHSEPSPHWWAALRT